MLFGLGLIVIIALMGGIIAYIGDKLGTKVGKRRITLFGLRPKHTSIIVTIITGILISAATLCILSIASSHVRTALFGMEQLQAQLGQLNADIEAKNKALLKGNELLQSKNMELEKVRTDVQATESELAATRNRLSSVNGELLTIQAAYAEAERQLEVSKSSVTSLETVRKELESHVTDLQLTTKRLEENITHVRAGNVVFRNGEILSAATVRDGLNLDESRAVLASVMKDTNRLIMNRFGMSEEVNLIFVSRVNLEDVAKQLSEAKTPMTIRITAAANIIYGEPALAEIQAYPLTKVYDKGQLVWSGSVQGGNDAQAVVLEFLKQVNSEAKERGILNDPLTGQIGSLPGTELFEVIHQIGELNGSVQLEAYAREDTYTSGPLAIVLRISGVR